MKIYTDLDLMNFNAWSGGEDTIKTLTYSQIRQLEAILEDCYDEMSDTQLNDILRFENETIAEWLGFESWEALENTNEGKEKVWNVYKVLKGDSECIVSFDNEDDAEEFCDNHNWEFTDILGVVWTLEIEEDWGD